MTVLANSFSHTLPFGCFEIQPLLLKRLSRTQLLFVDASFCALAAGGSVCTEMQL